MAPRDKKQQEQLVSSKDEACVIRIDDGWYDLTKWKAEHPGGAAILGPLHGEDATDAFYSLHSNEAIARLKRMHSRPATGKEALEVSKEERAFREFREQLRKDGWFERNVFLDAFQIGAMLTWVGLGWYFATSWPLLAVALIGLGMQQAGWLGHDYVHGRGTGSWYLGRVLGGFINGFSSEWWSEKHNTHHVYTNHVDRDHDVQLDPVFYLEHPDRLADCRFRGWQHVYFLPVCAIIYVSWRQQSLMHAWRTRNWAELLPMAVNYAWLLSMPWAVSVGSILFGGFLVGVVVTATHQSEDFIHPDDRKKYNFVREQFETTRNAYSPNPVVAYVWGGMDTQLEHHLFPTMPKYRYRQLTGLVEEFAKQNDLPYKVDGAWEIIVRNLRTMRRVALSTMPSDTSNDKKRD